MYPVIADALFSSLVSFWAAALRCARMYIHQSVPWNISVSIVLSSLFLLPMFAFVVDSSVVDFYYQELYRVSLYCNRGTDILTNVKNYVLDFCTPHCQVLLWLLNCEYWVSSTYLRMCFMYIILTSNCIAWEFDYFKLNMLWWWCCYFLWFVHFSSHPNLLCLIQSCS